MTGRFTVTVLLKMSLVVLAILNRLAELLVRVNAAPKVQLPVPSSSLADVFVRVTVLLKVPPLKNNLPVEPVRGAPKVVPEKVVVDAALLIASEPDVAFRVPPAKVFTPVVVIVKVVRLIVPV